MGGCWAGHQQGMFYGQFSVSVSTNCLLAQFKRRLDRYPGIVRGLLEKSQSSRGVCVDLLGYSERIMNDIVKLSDMEEEI